MIVGETAAVLAEAGGRKPTLDDLFRRAGMRDANAVALADPQRTLTYAQADRIVWAIAARLRGLGLATDSVVALQLPNSAEGILTLLGVLRAGLIAALLPQLWRESEIVDVLGGTGARALIADGAQIGPVMAAAAQLFSVRQVCAFGDDLPDGIVPLDDVMRAPYGEMFVPEGHADNPAAHAAVMTFEPTPRGIVPILRNHTQLIAGGEAVAREAALTADSRFLTATPISSFAGLCVTLIPWLLSGSQLVLELPFDAESFIATQYAQRCDAVVLPGPALAIAQDLDPAMLRSVIALWRAPELADNAAPWAGTTFLTDVRCFGEYGLAVSPRTSGEPIAPLPANAAHKRLAHGNLSLHGPMVASSARTEHFADTLYPCREDNGRLIVSGPQPGMVGIGGYRIARHEIDANAAVLAPYGTVAALPDALTGQRLKGRAEDPALSAALLAARGINPLIAGAFGVCPAVLEA